MDTAWKAAARAAAVVGVAALAACGRGDAAENGTAVEDAALLVGAENVYVVQPEEIASGPVISGSLRAENEAQVRAEVGGAVLGVFAEPGQAVARGQALARIDDAALREGALSAQSAVRAAEQQVDQAAREVRRAEALAAGGAIADRDLENAANALTSAQAQLAGARAQQAQAQRQLEKTTVRSPIAGVVSARPVNAGDVVQPGGALFTVVDPGDMRLEGSIPAAELGTVKVGAPVRFTVTGYPDQAFTGTVSRINPSADPVTRQVPVIVTIPNEQGRLVSGLFAEGRVQAAAREGIVVPASAVDERGVQPAVLRLADGTAQRVAVRLGVRDPDTDRVEVVSGIGAGDTLLIGAALGTTPGTRVNVRAAEGTASAGAP